MDEDLLLDFYGFLPEKYFLSRNLIKNFQTRASFVDYERAHYNYMGMRPLPPKNILMMHWTRNQISCQEYGPTFYSKDCSSSMWLDKRGLLHRKTGPAVINKLEIAESYHINRDDHSEFFPPSSEKRSEWIKIPEVWFEDGKMFKFKTDTGIIVHFKK